MIFTDVSDTIHADSLALFALNIEILLSDITKPENFAPPGGRVTNQTPAGRGLISESLTDIL